MNKSEYFNSLVQDTIHLITNLELLTATRANVDKSDMYFNNLAQVNYEICIKFRLICIVF